MLVESSNGGIVILCRLEKSCWYWPNIFVSMCCSVPLCWTQPPCWINSVYFGPIECKKGNEKLDYIFVASQLRQRLYGISVPPRFIFRLLIGFITVGICPLSPQMLLLLAFHSVEQRRRTLLREVMISGILPLDRNPKTGREVSQRIASWKKTSNIGISMIALASPIE